MKKLVIFDFDGVLVDTLGIAYSIDKESNENLSVDEFKSFFESNVYDAKRTDGTPVNYRHDYDSVYISRTRELKIPEILKIITRDLSSDYILSIISSTTSASINHILQREGVLTLFQDVAGRDIHRSKVFKIKMLLEKYKIKPENAVFITDTVGDITEARECGVKSVAVTWGFHDEKTLRKGEPDAIVNSPENLIKSIKEILND
jgi:phosphoglycolate phosphatase